MVEKRSATASKKTSAGNPSARKAYYNEVTSDSDDECEVADCALLPGSSGAKVLGPAVARKNPDVDLLKSASFPAKSASV